MKNPRFATVAAACKGAAARAWKRLDFIDLLAATGFVLLHDGLRREFSAGTANAVAGALMVVIAVTLVLAGIRKE